jgi:lipoprotein-anchoring transpeptidase ErfK/SrfK
MSSRLELKRLSPLAGLLMALWATTAEAGSVVDFSSPYSPGTIVISQSARTLYLIIDSRSALAYPVAVAKRGKEWSGSAHVDGKYVAPPGRRLNR